MKIFEKGFYHIYNQGNNKQPIFLLNRDYEYFIELCHKYIVPRCQILAWCLLPDHFNFIIQINEKSLERIVWGGNEMPSVSNGFQLLQSIYAKTVNARENRTGSLFRQKTKAKLLETKDHAYLAFRYVQRNPLKARIVNSLDDWTFSSYNEYLGYSKPELSNVELGEEIFGIDTVNFKTMMAEDIDEEELKEIL
jgi:REP element-mobilizing transposase RayT